MVHKSFQADASRVNGHQPINKGYANALVAILIWAGFAIVSRMGGKSPLLFYDMVALRFGMAAVLLLPFAIRYRVNLLNPRIIMLALTGGVCFALTAYYGFTLAPAAHGAILMPGMLPLPAPSSAGY